MKKTIFFDFNGTIIDDLDLCIDILNRMLIENGKSKVSKRKYKNIFTFPISDYYKKAGFDFSKKSFEDLSIDFINYYQQASLDCKLHKGVIKAFKEFKKMGINLVCLSASQIDNLKEQMNHFNISKYFDAILGINDIYAKSKVEIGLEYIEKNNIDKSNAIMIGDTLHDVLVSSKMGIECVLYDKGHQSRKVLESGNTKIVSSYKEFVEYIKAQK